MDRRNNENSETVTVDGPVNYVDSLRMSPAEQKEILSRLSQHEHSIAKNRRKKERLHYTNPAGLIVQMRHPGGSASNFLVRARNLSTTGIGFLHGSFVYTGTPCMLALRAANGKVVGVEGLVARCQHVKGHVHDIGVSFSEPIDLAQFISGPGEEAGECSPSTELPRLRGNVLIVEDSISDQDLMQFQLESLGVKFRAVSNGLDAIELVDSVQYDMIITSMWLPGMTGAELTSGLRKAGFMQPIVAVTADDKPETRTEMLERGCTDVLVKPYQLEAFVAVMSKHLPTNAVGLEQSLPMESLLWGNAKMRPLICKFLSRLVPQVNEINRLLSTPGAEPLVQKFCMDLKGTAGGYGYPEISAAARDLLKEIAADGASEKVRDLAQKLLAMCQSASLVLNQQSAAIAQTRSA
jgi:CheY-like chemotaxis protein